MDIKQSTINLFETEYMRHVIRTCYDGLSEYEIAAIVIGSRATLAEKANLFEGLARDTPFFIPYRNALRFALDELKGQSVSHPYRITSLWRDGDENHPTNQYHLGLVPTFHEARCIIRQDATDDDEDAEGGSVECAETQEWYEVERCVELPHGIDYHVKYWCGADGEPRYFKSDRFFLETPEELKEDSLYQSLLAHHKYLNSRLGASFLKDCFWPQTSTMPRYLPLPLKPGDLVMVDCMPQIKTEPAIVTDNRNPWDCCHPQILSAGRGLTLQEGALKHAEIGGIMGRISPLYRLHPAEERDDIDPDWFELARILKDEASRRRFERINKAIEPELSIRGWIQILTHSRERSAAAPSPIDFIDSKDIRDYLKATEWQPSAFEAAYLIWQSKTQTIESKHNAWKRIISTMPDESIKEGVDRPAFPSLHRLLTDYMDIEKKLLGFVCRDLHTGANYWTFKARYLDGSEEHGQVFRTFDELVCFIFGQAGCGDLEYLDMEPSGYIITKKPFAGRRGEVAVRVTSNLEPISMYCDYGCPAINKREDDLLTYSFPFMWFNIPTPFRAGDILRYVHPSYPDAGPFVLAHDPLDPSREYDARRLQRLMKTGDESDMIVSGYGTDNDGNTLFHIHFNEVLQLEFHKQPLTGFNRILAPLSRFAAGEIDLNECLERCEHVRSALQIERHKEQIELQKEEVAFQFGEAALRKMAPQHG